MAIKPLTASDIAARAAEARKALGKTSQTPLKAATQPAADSAELSTKTEGKKKGALRRFFEEVAPFIQDKP